MQTRRNFLKTTASLLSTSPLLAEPLKQNKKISLAQWSLHKHFRQKKIDNLDFPKFTSETFQIHAVEWLNSFFSVPSATLGKQPKPQSYLSEMKTRCVEAGVETLLIMCDGVGAIGAPDKEVRQKAIEGHKAWLEATKFLGGHSIRVNATSASHLAPQEQAKLCVDGLTKLSELATPLGLNVIVENHGGLSSDGAWLAGIIKSVGRENCGTLPDFGNFYIVKKREGEIPDQLRELYTNDKYKEDEKGIYYDPYQGLTDLIPYAKGISAKSNAFTETGEEVNLDYSRLVNIIKNAGFNGHIGIEYEGAQEIEGIRKTQALLQKYL